MVELVKDQTTVSLDDVVDVPAEELHFDSSNPRLFLEGELLDKEIVHILWRNFAVDEVAMSIANNGYFRYEPLFVAHEKGRLIVVEGNRRLAAVRLLVDSNLRKKIKATDLPQITETRKKDLEKLPVIMCQREKVWQYVGFKHVNGPQPWQSYAKAKYIAWVYDLGVSLDEIARQIGDRHSTVLRLYRGLMVLRQAQSSGVFDLEDRWKKHFSFSHLYTGLDYPNTREFLGIDNKTSYRANPVPVENLTNLGEFCLWLYGQKSTKTKPLVQSQNPDLRRLDKSIRNSDSRVALRRGLSLDIAEDISIGDEELFKGHLQEARSLLQLARGRQPTGDPGNPGTLRTANEILDLAERLVIDMEQHRRDERTTRRKRRAAVS